jgi:NAD(P)-dependent dehydrogenase (short-subunit alcohol dehydrogenase family)
MRMRDKVVVLIGAGQSPGEGVGNGRAAALLYAREGARVLAVDRDLQAAQATADAVIAQGGVCEAIQGDARHESDIAAAVGQAVATPWGPIAVGASGSCILFVALGILGMRKKNNG